MERLQLIEREATERVLNSLDQLFPPILGRAKSLVEIHKTTGWQAPGGANGFTMLTV